MQTTKTYIPAAGSDWFLPLYDPMTKLFGVDNARRVLLDLVELRPNSRVLEIGCGTGTFSILIKQLHPQVEVVGLDPDPKALARARRKAEQAGVPISLDQGFSNSLPYENGTFDYVFSSMMFHHLKLDEKEKTLREIRRVLKPAGVFAMLDLKKPESTLGRVLSGLFHSDLLLKDNSPDRILALMHDADLHDPKLVRDGHLVIGNVGYYEARNC
jgi:ubiquinone/menaquinone biosynthesis C-methylase UbiE